MQATVNVKGYGSIKLELYPDKAPETVKNFVTLANSGFYNGLIFHRVIKGFMIQGGGMDEEMNEKRSPSIHGEFASNGCRTNDIKHVSGVISMARTMAPNSASSQFFIMHKDAPHLDGQYAAFGKVIEGMDVVDRIASVKTHTVGWFADVPAKAVVIESVTVS